MLSQKLLCNVRAGRLAVQVNDGRTRRTRMNLDKNKIAEGAMAILALTMFKDRDVHRAWKGIDWDVMHDLCDRGWIHDPKGNAKSIVFTDAGRAMALECMQRQFGASAQQADAVDAAPPRR